MRNRSRHPEDLEDDGGRPLGITIIVILGVIEVLLTLVLVAALAGTPGGALAFVLLVLAILQVILLYGFWTLQSWAWPAGLIVYTLTTLGSFADGDILGLVINLAILVYLLTVREVFLG